MLRAYLNYGLIASVVVFMIGLSGCASATQAIPPPPIVVRGTLDYNGNLEYLPRTIEKTSNGNAGLHVRYQYEVQQGREDGIDFFVPLLNRMYAGRSGRWVVAVARVDLVQGGKETKSFSSVREVAGGGVRGRSLTDLRKEALYSVRDDLERQMIEAVSAGTLFK